jgi:mRNA-degrading endonuclease RelE of RelBE toxin-antitoxin system
MYEVIISDKAKKRLSKLPKAIGDDIVKKIYWLAENADFIAHERLKGREEYCLHCGPYRIPYLLDRTTKVITIEDIGKHNEVYRRLKGEKKGL